MSFWSVFLREAKRLFSDISTLTVCLIGPLFYFFLYPTPYENDIVQTQKIAIIDNDNTRLSQELAFLVDSSSEVQIYTYSTSIPQAKSLLEQGKIFGILYIPRGFEKKAYLQSSPNLVFFANSSYFLIYGSIMEGLHGATQALTPFIREKQRILYGKYSDTGANYSIQKDLITLKSSPLFNPSLGYINYALAAIFVVILHQMLLVGMGLFGSSFDYSQKLSAWKLIASRMLLFGGICVLLFTFYFGFGFSYYGVHHNAKILDFWLMALAFIFAIVAFGNFFGIIVKQGYQATQVILLCSLPLVFLLGFIWPSYMIPSPINFFTQFIPLFHGVNALLRLNEMGASFASVFGYFQSLIGLGVFYTLLALAILYYKQSKAPNLS